MEEVEDLVEEADVALEDGQVIADEGEGVINFVGDAGDHEAQGGKFFGLDQVGFSAFEVVVGFFEFESGLAFGGGELEGLSWRVGLGEFGGGTLEGIVGESLGRDIAEDDDAAVGGAVVVEQGAGIDADQDALGISWGFG